MKLLAYFRSVAARFFHRDEDDPVQSYPDYLDLRDRNRSFESLAYRITEAGLDAGENPSRVFGYEVSGNYFDALAFSRTWAVSSMGPTSMARTARHTWCSATITGTAVSTMIAAWWAASCGSTSILSPLLVSLRLSSTGLCYLLFPISFY